MDEARRILKDTFGHEDFKLSQAQVIERLIVGNSNCLVLYPTGGGKSLTYQIPGIYLPGLTLIISPLLSLMKDQVDVLRKKNVSAASLDSTLTVEEIRAVKGSITDGTLKMLYVAPERLNNEGFIELMRNVTISLLAVDESHCISQWGASFRPDYLKIARFAEEHQVERVLCLTATATPSIAEDICKSFHIDKDKGVFRIPVYRSNLEFCVKTATNFEDKLRQCIPDLRIRTGPAIIYVTQQHQTEETKLALKQAGLDAEVYHAGIKTEERKLVQDKFMASKNCIVVATIAFGMGIDKNNIRQVIHLYMPKTLENYSQEVGRAGRDGIHSMCTMFLCPLDIPVLEGFCRGDTCSKTSIQLWLAEVLNKVPDYDGVLSFNQYEQSQLYDIRPSVLNLLYAQLELQHNLIRAVTPFYTFYTINPRSTVTQTTILADGNPVAEAIRAKWRSRPRAGGWEIDVVAASTEVFPRHLLSKQINIWEMDGLIDTTARQSRSRFQILKELPKTSAEQDAIAEDMFHQMLVREEDAIQRLDKVIKFATEDDCLAQSLAAYFGDNDAVPNDGMCLQCTFCKTVKAIPFTRLSASSKSITASRIETVLSVCKHRDDPRMLTRIAFGITSPRITAQKLSRHPVFGSLVDVDFNMLLKAFTEECEKAGGQIAIDDHENVAQGVSTKRDRSQASSGRGAGRGAAKRGRFIR